jgi:transposase
MFGWRRQARGPVEVIAATQAPVFVPAVVEAASPERPGHRQERKRAHKLARISGIIEVEIDRVMVRVGRGAEARTVAAVIRALKAGA